MQNIWVRLMKGQKIRKDITLPCETSGLGDVMDAFDVACQKLDVARPMMLGKHESELAQFSRTIFLPEHFMEEISFDRMEIELYEENAPRRRSNDPRNEV